MLRADDMKSTPDQAPHADERDETLEVGLRMIARLIARAHLRRQGALNCLGRGDCGDGAEGVDSLGGERGSPGQSQAGS